MKILIALFQTDDTSDAPHLVTAATHAELLKKAINWCKERYGMSDTTALQMYTFEHVEQWTSNVARENVETLNIHVYKEEI